MRRTKEKALVVVLITILIAQVLSVLPANVNASPLILNLGNNILNVSIESETSSTGIGTFTIKTGTGHPNPDQDVFYGGAAENPRTSFTTIRVEDALKEYVTSTNYGKTPSSGYTVLNLDDYSPVATKVSDTQATITWTTSENLLVTLLITVQGTTIADTMVEVTITVKNNDANPHSVAIRHEWDLMIDGNDDSWIRPWTDTSTPQSWTETETTWDSPSFKFWETTNDPANPVFSIYGSTSLPSVTPAPTVPDKIVYAAWSSANPTAYDYTPTGLVGEDSAVLYYWNAVSISPGAQISRTAYVTTVVQAALDSLAWSTDFAGNAKSTFQTSDNAYVKGSSFPASTDATIYLIPDGQNAQPSNAVASASATTTASGDLPNTLVWSSPLAAGQYDIWVDVNENGAFDAGDVWNNQAGGIAAFNVEAEYTLEISVTPAEGGSVSANYSGPYHLGDVVELTAVPEVGWAFTGWGGDLTGSDNPAVFSIEEDMEVIAIFAETGNLLENPGFEDAESGLAGWSQTGGTANYYPQESEVTPPHSGFYSCRGEETDTGNLGRLFQDVTEITSPGNAYQISGWIKTSGVNGSVVIALDYVDAEGGWTPGDGYVREIGQVTGTQDWAFFESDVFTLPPMPSDANALWFLFDFNNGAGTAWFDDVSLLAVGGTGEIDITNAVEGEPPEQPWNYTVTDTGTGNVVANFTLPAGGGTTSLPALAVGDYLVTEITKYYYETSVDVDGAVFEDSQALVHLEAGHVVSVTFTNTAAAFLEPGFTFGSLDAAPPSDLSFPFPEDKLIPVQSAWPIDKNAAADGKYDLVVNKTMAILVNVTDAAILEDTLLTVSVTFDGVVYTDVTATGSALSRLIAVYPIVPSTLGEKTISGTYRLGAGSPIPLTSTVVTVRDTVVLKLFFAYFTPKQPANYAIVTPANFAEVAANITEFINATFPVKQVIANSNYNALAGNATASKLGGAKKDMQYLASVAKRPASGLGTDAIGVAIVPDTYFTYHGYPAGVVGAMVTPSTKACIVSESWFAAAAHEVAHVLYSVFYAKEYYNTPALKGKVVSGVWAEKGEWRTGFDIMDYAGPPDGNWIGNAYTYMYLFKNTTKTIADPEILFASGTIYQNGTIELNEWYRTEQGTPDTVVPGNYSLRFLYENGTEIAAIDFDASFHMEYIIGAVPGQDEPDPSTVGDVETDSASFSFATVLPEGTATVELVNMTDPEDPDGEVVATVEAEDITPPPTESEAYFTDSNFEPMDSFDVLFKKTSSRSTTLTLTATDPATYYYTLDFKNNGPTLYSLPITIKIPSDFVLEGAQPVTKDFSPVCYTFAGGVLRVTVPNIASGKMFTLRVHLDYKLKGTKPYPADSPTTYLKSYVFETSVNGVAGEAPSIRADGKKATAIGGFVTDTCGRPKGGLQVRVYKGVTEKGRATVDGDGFYFVEVQAGGPYSIKLFNSNNQPVWLKTGVSVASATFVQVDFKVLPVDCAIQGFVKDNHNSPVAGVTIKLLSSSGNVIATTTTNLGGFYVFRFYHSGTYAVRIVLPPDYSAPYNTKTVRVRLTETAMVDFDLIKT